MGMGIDPQSLKVLMELMSGPFAYDSYGYRQKLRESGANLVDRNVDALTNAIRLNVGYGIGGDSRLPPGWRTTLTKHYPDKVGKGYHYDAVKLFMDLMKKQEIRKNAPQKRYERNTGK